MQVNVSYGQGCFASLCPVPEGAVCDGVSKGMSSVGNQESKHLVG